MAIGEQQIRFTRNAGGQVIREVLGSHLKRWTEYDESGYLTRQTVAANTGPLFEQEYSYDRTGNLIKKVDSVFGTDKYYYDTMGRINRQIDPLGQVQKFLYDPAGDRLVTRIEESANGDWSRIGECDRTTYRFNRAGNLVSRTEKQETAEFIWDANQRLVASIKNGQETTYGYDPLGRRISKITAGVETRFYWDGDALLGELRFETKGKDGTDEDAEPVWTRWREWVYYPGSFEPLAMVEQASLDKDKAQPERIYYYANDPNGCPTRLLDEAGKVVWAAWYDAWGKVKKLPANEVDQPLRLQGQYFDAETGLHYTRWRYYCPEIGSFISQDPLGLAAGENVYSFGPNVQTWNDPLGLCKKKVRTAIDNKVTDIDQQKLPDWIAKSFTDSQYRTVVTKEDVTLYRVFGGNSDAGGAFATTAQAGNRINAKISCALLPEWGGSKMYEATIVVPKGQILNIGKVAPQTIKSTGTVLDGGADQILMPQNWPLDWIKGVKNVPSR